MTKRITLQEAKKHKSYKYVDLYQNIDFIKRRIKEDPIGLVYGESNVLYQIEIGNVCIELTAREINGVEGVLDCFICYKDEGSWGSYDSAGDLDLDKLDEDIEETLFDILMDFCEEEDLEIGI